MDPEKMNLTEEDIKNRYISPAIFETAGWKKKDSLMEYYYTDGQINVVDDVAKRGNGKKVDYLLLYKPNYPIAVIEAKDRKKHALPSAGLQQGMGYARDLQVPFAYTTNQGCKSISTYAKVDNKYVYYAIKFSVPDMYKRASGTTFKEISGTRFGETVIPLPPLEEQKRIITKVEKLQSSIGELSK